MFGGSSGIKEALVCFLTGEVAVGLHPDGNDPVERKKFIEKKEQSLEGESWVSNR